MPFINYFVEPKNIGDCKIPEKEKNELEYLSNSTLCKIIQQLSSLGEHATSLFLDLIQDSINVNKKSNEVIERIEKLTRKLAIQKIRSIYSLILI